MATRHVSRLVRGVSATALSIALTGAAATATAPIAQAVTEQPDLQVQVSAPRNILPADGWSSVSTTVRNLGTAPAANVRLVITFPDQLHTAGRSTTDEWECTSPPGWPRVETCDYVGELAAGATTAAVTHSAYGSEAVVGQTVHVRGDVTGSSEESDLSNNATTAAIRFVGKGWIDGMVWHDLNANGIREAGEPGVSAQISFFSVDDEDQYGYANLHGGLFDFEVPAKKYYGEVKVRKAQWGFTMPDVGDDTTDSDMTQVSEDSRYRTARSSEFVVAPDGTVTIDVGLVSVS